MRCREKRQQDRRFEAIHVLRRDRADDGVDSAVQQSEARGAVAHAADQDAPRFSCRAAACRSTRR